MREINKKKISISAVSALAAVNSFFAISSVDANSNQNKVTNNKKVQSKTNISKKSLFRLNANLSENGGKPYSLNLGIFKPLSIGEKSISYFDSSIGLNYEEITNKSTQSINQSKTGFSTSFRLGKRNTINDKWIGGINFGLITRSIDYYSPRSFSSGVIEIEFLSNKLKVIPYGNFSLTDKKILNTTSTISTTLTKSTTTTNNLFITPLNKYGIEIERTINEALSLSLDSFYTKDKANLKDGFGFGVSFSYKPGQKTKIRSGLTYDPITDNNLNTEIEYQLNNDSLEKHDERLTKTPKIRNIPLKIYNQTTIEESNNRFLDLSAISINPAVPLESPVKLIAEDLVNFEQTETV